MKGDLAKLAMRVPEHRRALFSTPSLSTIRASHLPRLSNLLTQSLLHNTLQRYDAQCGTNSNTPDIQRSPWTEGWDKETWRTGDGGSTGEVAFGDVLHTPPFQTYGLCYGCPLLLGRQVQLLLRLELVFLRVFLALWMYLIMISHSRATAM